MILETLFWLLLLLCAIGALVPDSASVYLGRSRWLVALILIAILGLKLFHNPTTH
jgi:hypothetical protein